MKVKPHFLVPSKIATTDLNGDRKPNLRSQRRRKNKKKRIS